MNFLLNIYKQQINSEHVQNIIKIVKLAKEPIKIVKSVYQTNTYKIKGAMIVIKIA